jgi:hypothetical protein
MWDTIDTVPYTALDARAEHLSHDRPCDRCGHAAHRYLPCDANCGCEGQRAH